ncbi:MAG: hypothetical protein ACYTGX_10720 [Planctomycetota bacterium]|jgi:hypothetical protein
MRAWLWGGFAVLLTLAAGCSGAGTAERGSTAHRSLWRLERGVPVEQARADLLALSHALEEYWLATAEANPSVRTKPRYARTPAWSCNTCNAPRPGTVDEPSGYPDGTCHRCGHTAAERLFRNSRIDMQGRYPNASEGLRIVIPFLRGAPLGETLADPWGRPYIYLSAQASAYGLQGIPRGQYLLYSTGPNGVDEGGAGDDISNLPELFIPSRITPDFRGENDGQPLSGPDTSRGFPARGILSWGLDFGLGFGFGG